MLITFIYLIMVRQLKKAYILIYRRVEDFKIQLKNVIWLKKLMKIMYRSKRLKKTPNSLLENTRSIQMTILLWQKKDIKVKLDLVSLINTLNMEEVTAILFQF